MRRRMEGTKPTRRDRNELAYIAGELKRLRRLLGSAPPIEEVRQQTRERVRRYRERQRVAA